MERRRDLGRETAGLSALLASSAAAFAVGERFGGPLAYARVDLVEGPGGGPLVIELTEPSLFFANASGAAQRLLAALGA